MIWLLVSVLAVQGKTEEYGRPGARVATQLKSVLEEASREHRKGNHDKAYSMLKAALLIAPARHLEDITDFPVRKLVRSVKLARKKNHASSSKK